MATTIQQGFEKLKRNLEITDLQSSTASTRQTHIREAVEEEMSVLDSFLTGSYIRNTMIAPLKDSDIDIFVVLDPKYYEQGGQASLLDKVKRVLKKTYPTTPDISRNGQAVTITFTDFKVDVVPGFNATGGGYLIPDSARKRWLRTNPKTHIDTWAASNKAHHYDLVPLLKMIKAWNKQHSALFRSFHLEAVVLDILNNVTISDFQSGVRYVFDKAREKIKFQCPDPAGYGDDVGGYMTGDLLTNAITRLETAYKRALTAEQLGRQNKLSEAFEKWGLVFGDYFPAYA